MEAKTDYLKMKQDEFVKHSGPTILTLAEQLGELAGSGDEVGIKIIFAHIDQLFERAVGRLQELHGTSGSMN